MLGLGIWGMVGEEQSERMNDDEDFSHGWNREIDSVAFYLHDDINED